MIKMSPFVASALLACLSIAYADVSHLTNNNNGYYYPNFGLSALHTPDQPPATQYANYGDHLVSSNLPNSYSPQPSGSPFATAAKTNSPQRLSAPLQSPLLAAQKQQSQSQTNYQQQPQQFSQTRNYPYQTQLTSTSNAYSQSQQLQPPAQTYQAPTFYTQGSSTTSAYKQQQQQRQQQQARSQEPIITKHFFVHAAPEDPEEQVAPRYVQLGPARKNYKIIFIKAPSYSSSAQIIPILPQNEEKTIVYVLSKKPSYEHHVELPELPVTEPSKPDVFFIKYKNQQEADQAHQSIQAAYDQANLAQADNADQIASQFVTDTDSASTAFGGQDSTQQNQLGGQSSSTTQVKRFAQRRF